MKARTEMALQVARSRGDALAVARLSEVLHPGLDLHFANGFDHPELVVYTAHDLPRPMRWGLVPRWAKDRAQADAMRPRALLARSESMFAKPTFREAAAGQRCLVHVEGFYEHHHFGRGRYHFFVHLRHRPFFALAGLWSEWRNPATGHALRTFCIVTTGANELMRRIHNNPRAAGPRMPVVLAPDDEQRWLDPQQGPDALADLLRPCPVEWLAAHPVAPLLGARGSGNSPAASRPYEYPELLLGGPLA
ncbi:MAG: SOS response-associated peptidase [Flavobacteriales bacterium]|nr:SOS response-associated peptidase [Flavobacteriales bacterium]